ncbi:hypothetical protein FB550_119101 [Neobacillus bataviensis]|uniref:Uncharacterized protein n=1 Tax=Neobacillus bataviensis TaxID=220685 RepID=A0A561CMX4_9BACI|nr:hypothetical protein [Neobacillus bataviensis]TWD92370.1 hypothetical protein FB550_119101 [Neobacillus bataviensis]
MNFNAYKKDEDNQPIEQEQIEDLNLEERVPEFDEIGTALNGI